MSVIDAKQHEFMLRAGDNLEVPVMKTPVVNGTSGTNELSYCAAFETIVGITTPSAVVTVTNGPATVNPINYVRLSVDSVPAGCKNVIFYKLSEGVYKYLGKVAASIAVLDDIGQTLQSVTPNLINTSGRPEWRGVMWNYEAAVQRPELMDMQWILQRSIKEIGDSIFAAGDTITGLKEQFVSGTTWRFSAGKIYLDGQILTIPTGTVTLTGTGKEVVGLLITPRILTDSDDPYLRNLDEGCDLEYAEPGAYRLVYDFTWVVDTDGQIDIREFLDNEPLVEVLRTERTEWQKTLERRTYDVSGSFSVVPFPTKCLAHDSDAIKLKIKINEGKAYVQGVEIATIAPQFPVIDKGRTAQLVEDAVADPFIIDGGSVVTENVGPYDVDGLKLLLQFGTGNSHTVTLSGSSQTASQVGTQITNAINAYPTSEPLVSTVATSDGKLQIAAPDGKRMVILPIAGDAYSVLGLTAGIYKPQGTRIYRLSDAYVKNITSNSYLTEVVEAVVYNGGTGINTLGNINVQDILGASLTEADAWDGRYDWQKNVDFTKDGNSINFAALGGANPVNGTTFYVKYHYSKTAVKGVRTRIRVIDALMTKGAAGGADNIVYTSATSIVEAVSGAAVTMSGTAKDVIRILRVNDSPGQSESDYTSWTLAKNSTELEHNVSQINWAAAGAQGVTPTGQPSTAGNYYVSFEAWAHTVEGDFVSPDSYLNDYEQIETAPNGTWNLRDCMDFRCSSAALPLPEESPRFNYEYFLSRIDRLMLGSDAYFFIVPGKPAKVPVVPSEPAGSYSIAHITVPPYTYSSSDVTIQNVEILRRTQQSIGELAAQLARLNYYQAMQQTQQAAADNPAAAEAKGIFTDSLIGQKQGDFQFKGSDGLQFTAAIDPMEQCMRLPVSEDGRSISVDQANSSGITNVGRVIMFDYEPSVFLSQPKASGLYNVNPHAVYGWVGTVQLTPESDFWTDIVQLPDLDINYDSQMQALVDIEAENAERARKITYGAWSLTWNNSGNWAVNQLQSNTDVHWNSSSTANLWGNSPNAARERTGTYSSLVPERTLVDLGNTVVDMTVIPYMRQIEVQATVKGLLSNIDVACTFDGIPVDLSPVGTTVAGTLSYQGKNTVRTTAAGSAVCSFTIPEGVRVGQKEVKIFSASDPEETYAISVFTSQGFKETHQTTVMGIISTVERDVVVTETQFHYGDPLAQTFAVESGTKWISAVNLYFGTKDPNLPVTVEVRKTSNGFPTRTVIQSCTLEPDQVNISDDATVPTTFTFDKLVGYTAGEYCFVVISNCQSYNCWYAKMGQIDIHTGAIIRTQPTDGVLYTSPNNSYWDGEADSDLMFDILEANFQNNAQIRFQAISGIEANMIVASITQFVGSGCVIHWSYSIDGGKSWIAFAPGIDTELGAIATEVQILCDVTGSGGTFQISEDAGIIALLNDLDADYIGHRALFDDDLNKITLVVDLACDGVNGVGTRSVTPYYTTDDIHWVGMDVPTNYVPLSVGDGTYKEYQFETPGQSTITGATNATPIVISAPGHKRKNNEVVTITTIVGNDAANGTFRVVNATADTFELTDPDTGAYIPGNGEYVSGGVINITPFTQCRIRFYLSTTNRAVTPKGKEIRCICSSLG